MIFSLRSSSQPFPGRYLRLTFRKLFHFSPAPLIDPGKRYTGLSPAFQIAFFGFFTLSSPPPFLAPEILLRRDIN